MGRPSIARSKLIESSQELFWLRGYENVSVDDLCQHAGVNKGSFYYFFKTKKDLALESNQDRWQKIEGLQIIDPQARDPLAVIIKFFKMVVDIQNDQANRESGCFQGCPFGTLGAELANVEPEITAQIAEILNQHIKFIENNLRLAKEKGLIEIKSPAKMARQIFSQWTGGLVLARIYNDGGPLQQALQTTRQILDGLRRPDPKISPKKNTIQA